MTSAVGGEHVVSPGKFLRSDYEAFTRREHDRLVALAAAYGGRRGGAEKIAARVLRAARRRWADLVEPEVWVRQQVIVRLDRRWHRTMRVLARHLRSLRQEDDGPEPHNPAVWEAVARLTPSHRAALALHHLEEADDVVVAAVLGCSPTEAHRLLGRARQLLARRLAPRNHDEI